MSARKESERTKFIQEKCQTLLTQMLRDEDNKYCVDCDAKGPRWASWNLGVFLCIRCAGIHRNLGVHISRVKSVNLDAWTPEQVVSLQQMGNSRARAVYEAQLPDGFRRPQTDSALESFIRAKYEHKKYMAREWVPSPPPKANWDKEIDEEMERQKRKKKSSSSSSTSSTLGGTSSNDKKTTITVKTPIPAPLPKPKTTSSSPKTSRITSETNTASQDLLELSSPMSTNGPLKQVVENTTVNPTITNSDVFTNFLSANPQSNAIPQVQQQQPQTSDNRKSTVENALAKEEQDFFNQTAVPNEKEKAKLTKDSIMALYGAAPTTVNNLCQFTTQTGLFSGTHVISGGSGVTPATGPGTIGSGYNQFVNSPMGNYKIQPHQMHGMTTGMGVPLVYTGASTPGGILNQQNSIPNYIAPTQPITTNSPNNLFGQQMMMTGNGGGGGGYSSTIGQQPPHQQMMHNHQQTNAFASFPPMQTTPVAYVSPATASITTVFQTQSTPATNGKINQQFANLNLGNVWQ